MATPNAATVIRAVNTSATRQVAAASRMSPPMPLLSRKKPARTIPTMPWGGRRGWHNHPVQQRREEAVGEAKAAEEDAQADPRPGRDGERDDEDAERFPPRISQRPRRDHAAHRLAGLA